MSESEVTLPAAYAALQTTTAELLSELVSHLRQSRTQLRQQWARRITEAKLLTAMTDEEIFAEATAYCFI
jgi:rsbT co-antagonist protein RsbR